MAIAARVKPTDYFTTEEWNRLSARSSWKGLALVAHAWAVVGLAMVAGVLWPITTPFGIMIVGARQLGLAILQHDAAHGALHPNLKINDWVAECQILHIIRIGTFIVSKNDATRLILWMTEKVWMLADKRSVKHDLVFLEIRPSHPCHLCPPLVLVDLDHLLDLESLYRLVVLFHLVVL
jgi:hypothetical protein